ncbi:MAG: flippase-like domain-containing protein [Ignavibacteria bacterium]|nr:flippase-like domain-containing protein [Ignavibacteria bacterium]
MIFFVIIYQKIHPEDIQILLAANSSGFILLAAMLLPFSLFIQYKKWKLLVYGCLKITDSARVFTSLMRGIAGGVVTPMRVGEYIGRTEVFPERTVLEVSIATAADKFLHVAVIYFFGAIAFLFALLPVTSTLALVLPVSLFIIASVIYRFRKINWVAPERFAQWKRYKSVTLLLDAVSMFRGLSRADVLKSVLWNVLLFLCTVSQYGLLFCAFSDIHLIFSGIWIGALTLFAKTLIPPFTIGDFGIREIMATFIASQLGFNSQTALFAALGLFIINIILPAALGIVFFFTGAKNE